MAYDENLARRVRETLQDEAGITEKKMFGGLAFLHNGHMTCGISANDLMVRVGPDAHEYLLAQPHARKMDFTGRPMKGMLFVAAEGLASDEDLWKWVQRGLLFTGGLPPKMPK